MASSPAQGSRVADSVDAEEVAGLLDRFQAEFHEYTPGVKILTARVREHIAHDLSVFLLAGAPHVGVAQLRFREYLLTGAPICYLEELYVVPDRRGEGHGRMLMQCAMSLARERRATTMELGTAANDTAARQLYESLGFTNLEKQGRPETQMLYYERDL
jgi:ribosomal protein S18 acetylase RimI-like enzyme